jgi:Trk K+ transport system NAD-binding subunit
MQVKTPRVMVIGFGDLARRLAPKLTGLAEVIGVSRRPELLPETLASKVYGDYTNLDSLVRSGLTQA